MRGHKLIQTYHEPWVGSSCGGTLRQGAVGPFGRLGSTTTRVAAWVRAASIRAARVLSSAQVLGWLGRSWLDLSLLGALLAARV